MRSADFIRRSQNHISWIAGELGGPGANNGTQGRLSGAMLHSTVLFLSQPSHPRGCFSVQAALACGVDAEPIQQAMVEWRKTGEEALRKRFVTARRAGELPREISPADLARFIATVMAGLAVQALNGATHDEMKRTADLALNSIGLA